MSGHLDLDELADVLAGGDTPAHLAGCAPCRAQLSELEAALPRVSGALATVTVPEPPAHLGARLTEALAAERGLATADVLPLDRRRSRWLPALAAVAAGAALVTGGVLVARQGPDRTTTSADSGGPTYAVSETGTDYSRTGSQLQSALPGLLKGGARRAAGEAFTSNPAPLAGTAGSSQKDSRLLAPPGADLLAPLRTTAGLARCLSSLTNPSDSGLPLALDYATFEGQPALVVVLPTSAADKVDVFVVPPGCATPDNNVLYFRRLPKP